MHTATTSTQVNRIELSCRPSANVVYTGTDIDSGTGRQSAGVNTGGRASTATPATRTCNDVRTIYPTYIVPSSSDENADFFDVDVDGLVSLFDECESPANDSIDANNVKLNVAEFDMDRFIADSNVSLHYVNLIVSDDVGNSVEVDSLFDSGTQLSVIKEELIESLQCDVLGEVTLSGFNGNLSNGKVISLNARMKDHDVTVPIRFVACRNVTQNCLLSLADYRKLLQKQQVYSATGQTGGLSTGSDNGGSLVPGALRTQGDAYPTVSTADAGQSDCNDHDAHDTRNENEVSDVLPLDNLFDTAEPNDTEASELANEQRADASLSGAFEFAKLNKGGYFVKKGLLFHRTKILDNFVERIVVPIGRRRALLELAHDKLGCHLRIRRTKDRIAFSFMWPTMNKDVVDYCRSCEICQKRAPITFRDCIPIEGGVVSVEPVFSHFMLMLLGLYLITRSSITTALYFLIIPQGFLMR